MRTIRAAVQLGATVDAIQLYREATGCDLAEATKAIEQMQAELGTTTPPNRAQCFWFGLFSLVCGSGLLFAGIAMPSKKNPMFPCVVLGGMFALCGIWMLASAASNFSAASKKAGTWFAATVAAGFSTMAFWVAIFDSKGIRGGIPFLPNAWNQSLGQIAFFCGGLFCLVLTAVFVRAGFRGK